MAITLHIEKKGNWEQLLYAGPINEDTEVHLMPLIAQLGPNVIFNFRKVEYVNSCGVRAWINFLREVEKNRKVIFEECTPDQYDSQLSRHGAHQIGLRVLRMRQMRPPEVGAIRRRSQPTAELYGRCTTAEVRQV
jgi:anti-anti-sigma regulatory factor